MQWSPLHICIFLCLHFYKKMRQRVLARAGWRVVRYFIWNESGLLFSQFLHYKGSVELVAHRFF